MFDSVQFIVIMLLYSIITGYGAYLWCQGGCDRAIGRIILFCSLGFVVANTLAVSIYVAWEGVHVTPYPWFSYILFEQLPSHTIVYQHFRISFFISYALVSTLLSIHFFAKYVTKESVLGDAHFASDFEIKKAGFFIDQGICVGKSYGKSLKSSGFEHVLVFAPTGSGKTTCIAIPNLLIWSETCVVNDPKFELYETTSNYRKKAFKNDIYLWAPTQSNTHRYNPLQFISSDQYKRIGEIQQQAHVIIPNGQGEPIWYQSSRELFLVLVLYLLDTPGKKATLPEVYTISKKYKFNTWLKNLVEKTVNYDPEFYRNASSYLNTAEKTRASILKTFTGYLELFADPIINAATSDSDFDLRALRKKKMTIYIGFSDSEKERLSPLLTIFWQQLISFMTEKMPKDEPYSVLCVMDEFSILGRLVNLKNSLKILRGYRVRMLIIIQYLAQIKEHYSQAESKAFDNIKTKISFAVDDLDDAKYISGELGMQTKTIKHRTTSRSSGGSSSSINYHQQGVPLMRPESIRRLDKNKVLIIRTGHAPIVAKKYFWLNQKELKDLPCGQVDIPYQQPVIVPFEHQSFELEQEAEALLQAEERQMAAEIAKEQAIYQHEIEKIKVQSEVFASAMVKAVDHINKKDEKND